MSNERTHSLYGGSSMARIIQCPGSVALVAQLPEGTESEHAAEGTAAHKRCAEILSDNNTAHRVLADETAESYDQHMRYVTRVLDSKARIGPDCIMYVEHGFDFAQLHPDAHSTCDAALYDPGRKRLEVYDLKWGKGKRVTAQGNPQLQTYALGLIVSEQLIVETCETLIIQPRIANPYSTVSYTIQSLVDQYIHTLKPAVDASLKPDAPLRVGAECWFCPAREYDVCPEQQKRRDEKAAAGFITT